PAPGEYADGLVGRVRGELARAEQGAPRPHPPSEPLEIERFPCVVEGHDQAREIARALDADVVIWGRTGCDPPAARHLCPPATLRAPARETRLSAHTPVFEDISDLDLPALPSAQETVLPDFAVGYHLYAQGDYLSASWILGEAARAVPDHEHHVEALLLF